MPQAPDSQLPLAQADDALELLRPTENDEICGLRLVPWHEGQVACCDP